MPKIREVHTGSLTKSGEIEVLEGLKQGDEVVIFGQDSIKENNVVNIDLEGLDAPRIPGAVTQLDGSRSIVFRRICPNPAADIASRTDQSTSRNK